MANSSPPAGAAKTAPAIKDGSTASFMADVIEGSRENLVVVDFWAPWCGPCKQLGPALERTVQAAKGAVRLVKINIDENPDLAREMHVQSIPAVYAFFQGRPIDGFMGALPESQVTAFVERLVKAVGGSSPAEALSEAVTHADALLAEGNVADAEQIYRQVLSADAKHAGAAAGIARARVVAGDLATARKFLERLPPELSSAPEVVAAKTALELAEQKPKAGVLDELQAKVASSPADYQLRLDLASALFADGQLDEAVSQLLEIVKRDRNWNEQAARKQLLKFFEALGPAHPATLSGRRQLSSLLFS
ncbi:MAG: co-chaperone YbbN [Alphaproteobacteria bacterium]